MKRVLLFGSTGNLGKEVAKELVNQGYNVTVVVRSESKAKSLCHITENYRILDVCDEEALFTIQDNYDVIVSSLGKSVSPYEKSKHTFEEVDLDANTNILQFAIKKKINKFVYISAFHAERYLHLEYCRVHHEFSERIKKSGLDYSIIKPPAIFSAFLDVIEMAKKGRLINLGKGDKRTNPIFEGDLAKVVVDSVEKSNVIVEVGGKSIYTRRQLNEIVNSEVRKSNRIRTVPIWLFTLMLPLIKLFDKNTFHKFAFFMEVIQHDTIAPQVGEMSFESYVKLKTNTHR